jgi:hypothetical protein
MADERPPRVEWAGDWEGHRRWQLTAALEATPAQRLAWLEEAIALAYRAGALPLRNEPSD